MWLCMAWMDGLPSPFQKTLVQPAARWLLSGDHSSTSSLTAFVMNDADKLWVWRYVKRTTLRGRGQSQSPNTPPRPKPPKKKLSSIWPSLATNEIMSFTAEECWSCWVKRTDKFSLFLRWWRGQLELACHRPLNSSARYVFSQITGRKKTGGREGRSRSLKRKLTASAERQDWNARSASNNPRWAQRQRGISPSMTHTQRECHQRAGDSRTSYNDGAAFATTLRWNSLF